jgi:hypothetical protein
VGHLVFATSMSSKAGIYRGVVRSIAPASNTLMVIIKDTAEAMPCIWAAGIISGMLGFKTSFRPPVKTEVVIWIPEKSAFGYVIGTLPSITVDPGMQRRDIAGDGATDDYTALQYFHKTSSQNDQAFIGHKPPVDLAEGELNIENWMGVGLSLLRNLSSLQAGDLARVECHVLDDMVRIISDTFKQYTAFGDYKIANDGGKLNVIWNGTSHDFEAWGNKQPGQPLADQPSRTDVGDTQLNKDTEDGRWRFTQYIGWLGNFMHTFITDPVDQVGRIAENQFRSGKAHIHVNDDGSVLVQSVADIVLEKVVRIPVPAQIRKEDDPKGNQSDQPLGHTEALKTWQPSNAANLFEMTFQLREYARWLNNTYALARFHQMDRDYQVPTEDQTPEPLLNGDTADKQAANGTTTNWQLRYCTIRIYRDGSIQTVDAYGNVITTTAIGIQISTPKDLLLQASGSINIVAGRDFNVLAQKNVNLSAVQAAVRLSSNTAMQFICTSGTMLYEVAVGMWHKFIGAVTYNNTTSISTFGEINAASSVTAAKLNASMSVNAPAVFSTQTYQSTPFQDNDSNGDSEANHTWLSISAPDVSINLPSVTDRFTFQTDYAAGVMYQTLTQQQVSVGDLAHKPSAGCILGAATGAMSGIQAAVAAAAAVINAQVPGLVNPTTGVVNPSAGSLPAPTAMPAGSVTPPTAMPAGSVTPPTTVAIAKLTASTVAKVNTAAAPAATKAGAAAATSAKALATPHLQTPCDLVIILEAQIQAYIKELIASMQSPVIVDELKKLAAELIDPLSKLHMPSIGALKGYMLDLSYIQDIEAMASKATAALETMINLILKETCITSIFGIQVPPPPATLDSLTVGQLSSTSGVVSSAAKDATQKYGSTV